MLPNNNQAKEHIKEAEKKLKPGLSNLFKPKEELFEAAAELYIKAANVYKINREYDEAANIFVLAAEYLLRSRNNYEAATSYIDAAKVLHNHNPEASITYYKNAITIFLDEGKFNIVARYQMIIAEQYEKLNKLDQAISAYELAAEYFESENNNANKNRCYRKIADLSAYLGKYEDAIKKYEDIIKNSLDNNLLKWGTKELYVLSTICHLANEDTVSSFESLDRFCDWDPSFHSTIEREFLTTICRAIENYNKEMFVDAIIRYDSLGKMDKLKTGLLLKIKKHTFLNNEDDEGLA